MWEKLFTYFRKCFDLLLEEQKKRMGTWIPTGINRLMAFSNTLGSLSSMAKQAENGPIPPTSKGREDHILDRVVFDGPSGASAPAVTGGGP